MNEPIRVFERRRPLFGPQRHFLDPGERGRYQARRRGDERPHGGRVVPQASPRRNADGPAHADVDGIEATRQIRAEFPEAKIIALTSFDGDQDIYRALEAGVRGYLLKEMVHTDVLYAIRIVHSGERLLRPKSPND